MCFMSESKGESFSFVGEVEIEKSSPVLSITTLEDLAIRDRGLPVLSSGGGEEVKLRPSGVCELLMRWTAGGGVLAGDDFCGEIDLARSV